MQIMGFILAFVLCQIIQCKIILFIATSNLLAILFVATSNLLSVGPRSEKFNIVTTMGARKSDFCVSVGKANFTDHDTPDTINGSRDSALVCQMYNCYCTIHKNFKHFHLAASDCSG